MNWEDFKTKKLTDIGSRYLHYSELISVWEEGADLISHHSYIGKHEQGQLDQLNLGIQLLRNTLDGMSDYHDTTASLRSLVDAVPPDATKIPGGRGTGLTGFFGPVPYSDIT